MATLRRVSLRLVTFLVALGLMAAFAMATSVSATTPGDNGRIALKGVPDADSRSGTRGGSAASASGKLAARAGLLQAKDQRGDRRDSQRNAGRIVWATPSIDFSSGHLVSSRPDGTGFRQLTPTEPDQMDVDPSISPLGRRLVYERDMPQGTELRIMGITGRDDHAVDFGCRAPCSDDLAPVWMPNGRIAFTRVLGPSDGPNGAAHSAVLYTAKPDGTDVKRLSQPGIDGVLEDAYARTVPGANYIVFRRNRTADFMDALFRMRLDGSHVRQLTPYTSNVDHFDVSPARSGPTKDLVLFETYPPGTTTRDLATVPAICTSSKDCADKVHFLTHNAGGSRRESNPTWSPNGRWMAFIDRASVDADHSEVWTMRYDGEHRHRLSPPLTVLNYRPDWGPTAPTFRTKHDHR